MQMAIEGGCEKMVGWLNGGIRRRTCKYGTQKKDHRQYQPDFFACFGFALTTMEKTETHEGRKMLHICQRRTKRALTTKKGRKQN